MRLFYFTDFMRFLKRKNNISGMSGKWLPFSKLALLLIYYYWVDQ